MVSVDGAGPSSAALGAEPYREGSNLYLLFTIHYLLISINFYLLFTTNQGTILPPPAPGYSARSLPHFGIRLKKLGVTMTGTDEHPLTDNSEATTCADGPSGEDTPAGNNAVEELRALAAEYDARMDEVAELIKRVRHEINNPLTGVLGQAQLLLREELPERARKRAEKIEELAIRIRDIVAELRQVQKTSRG